ncbi:hypothetical protein JCM33374_g3673 [Metschnikowia sp. JCM 33374]|nr:hypothetical protein JCM33374_g3673 [Metschnikowia sp. JCM 33374]
MDVNGHSENTSDEIMSREAIFSLPEKEKTGAFGSLDIPTDKLHCDDDNEDDDNELEVVRDYDDREVDEDCED